MEPTTLERLHDWLKEHTISSGSGYDCVQARDVAHIIGYVQPRTEEEQ